MVLYNPALVLYKKWGRLASGAGPRQFQQDYENRILVVVGYWSRHFLLRPQIPFGSEPKAYRTNYRDRHDAGRHVFRLVDPDRPEPQGTDG